MKVRLTRKLAEQIDGIDLSHHQAGDVIELPETDARTLFAEEWAIEERREPAILGRVLAFRRSTDPGHRMDDDEDDGDGHGHSHGHHHRHAHVSRAS